MVEKNLLPIRWSMCVNGHIFHEERRQGPVRCIYCEAKVKVLIFTDGEMGYEKEVVKIAKEYDKEE